jgi:hypothetical protein
MFAVLSIGILIALTGTGISQVAPAFADKEECEDNDDNNCNERTHKIKQDNDCKAENEYEKIGSVGSTTNNNDFVCVNVLTSPANGDDNVFGDIGIPITMAECIECLQVLENSQIQQLAVILNDQFGLQFPANPTRAQIIDIICEALEQGPPHPGLVPGEINAALAQIDSVSNDVRITLVNCLRGF